MSTPRWHLAVVATLMLAAIFCGASASIASSDTNRDIFFAQQIASGNFFPLTGPDINRTFHLGPLWYYLLAPALWFYPNAAAVTGWMGAIYSLQFPLAYIIGRNIAGPRQGLLFTLALAIPGWITVSFAGLTHTMMVVPSILLGVLAARHYRAVQSPRSAVYVGISLALMLAAHPTTLLIGLTLVTWALYASRNKWTVFLAGGIVFFVVAMSFAPMLFEQWRTGSADWTSTVGYVDSDGHFTDAMGTGRLLIALCLYGPKYLNRFWLQIPSGWSYLLLALYLALLLIAVIGIGLRIRLRDNRLVAAMLLGMLLLQSVFVSALRDIAPPWVVFAHWPIFAALIAYGLNCICERKSGLVICGVLLAVTTCWTFGVYASLAQGSVDSAEIKASPGNHGLADIRDYENAKEIRRLPRLAFRDLFALGRGLCDPVTLYGHYAYLVDYTFGVSAMVACGSTISIQFGGSAEHRHQLAGLHRVVWKALDREPDEWIGDLGIAPPIAVWKSPSETAPTIPRLINFSRVIFEKTTDFLVEGDASKEDAVVVSHRAHRYVPFKVVEARANGDIVEPSYADILSSVFAAPVQAGRKVHWAIRIRASESYVDVFTIR